MTSLKLSINRDSNTTIQQQLINAISRAIASNELKQGESLPSINKISRDLTISRDTIFKAYQELKRLKVVDSTPAKGYYVNNNLRKILLLLDYFSPFKESLHNTFKKNIPKEYSIDLAFHHYNLQVFETIIQNSIGLYDLLVVMNPDTSLFKIHPVFKKIDPSKLLFVDIPIKDWNGFASEKYSTIYQNFDKIVYDELSKIKDVVLKYDTFNLILERNLNHPEITTEYFIRFCYDIEIECRIYEDLKEVPLQKGQAYFVLQQRDLSYLLRQCQKQDLEPGTDIGILAYNDSPLYEFIGKGISVITTDFELMGKKAAETIKGENINKELIPSKIILRGSL